MSALSASIGGTRRFMVGLGQYGLLLGPVRRAFVEPASGISDELLRLLLCYHGRRLWEQGFIAGRCGNLSARAHAQDAILITPRGTNKGRLSISDIQRASLLAAPADSSRISVEFPMHRSCYLADVRVGAVIHTHAPYLTALGIRGGSLGDVLPEAAVALGGVARVSFAPSGSETLAERVGAAVADGARMLLLERHGALAVGRDLADAHDRMEFAELSAKAVMLAAGLAAA